MALTTFVSRGDTIPYTPGSAVAAGAVVALNGGTAGKRLGIATEDIAANQPGALQVEGIFDMPKVAADVIAVGEKVYWDAAAQKITITASTNTMAGYAVAAAGNGATRVRVKLNAFAN